MGRSLRGLAAHGTHLVRRFTGSLSSRPPSDADLAWALAALLPGEQALWLRHNNIDRRHTIQVARRACRLRATLETTERDVLAAALLHDVGKIDADLGTLGRIGATLWGAIAPQRARAGDGRASRYLRHGPLGAQMAAMAGSAPRTVSLIGRDPAVSPDLLAVLDASDDI
jgi:putative nucleotidyltransferase with HDIG domain